MNGFKLITLAAVVALAGCSATEQKRVGTSPAQYYRADSAKNQIKITGQIDASYNYFDIERPAPVLTVFIDGNEAIKGPLSHRYTGEVSGNYSGMAVDSVCSSEQKTADSIDVQCLVLIDNERAATLTF